MVIREHGTVESIEGGQALVRLRPARPEACHRCRACRGIGAGEYIAAVGADDLGAGDRVTVEVPIPGPWRAIGWVLAVPLVAMVVGAILGAEVKALQRALGLDADSTALALGAAMGAAALAAAVLADRRFRRRRRPRVVERESSPANRKASR